jgi:predicted ATPase/DNA-binding winged helix-turn-helix (wHTH) protein
MSEPTRKFYAFGPFMVDVRRQRLLRAGAPVALTPKAFELLLALIEQRGQVLEKDELLKKVWPDQFVEEANLTVNMSALRKALGERASENQYILTVPRQGYRFVADVRELASAEAEPTRAPEAESATPAESRQTPPATAQQRDEQFNNLPVQLTPFIGRKAEAAAVEKLLRREDVRLVTLTGPGGSGKTRLALHVVSRLLDECPAGVFFVALEPITDPHLVISTIAQTLGVKEAGGTTLIESLKSFLRYERVLLILDNFEQVISAAPLLSSLLTATLHLKMLVTSRAALRLSGEHEFQVPPLLLPNLGGAASPAHELLQYTSVELFVQRAMAAKSDFLLTERNAHAVAEICIQLDGLPLAIELAAARIKLLPPQAMLVRLETPFKLLTGGARNLPMRQQTMSGTIAWSYDLLTEAEQRLFRRLSVFVGGATLAAAEAVCNPTGDLGLDVHDGVASLVDNSLLRQLEQAGGEPRFVMLETIREYGLERLKESGELAAIQQQHAHYFLRLAEEADPELGGAQLTFWLEQLEEEYDNLRAVLRWSAAHKEEETALRLVGSLWWFWYLHGHYCEGREWVNKILPRSSPKPSVYRARALIGAGVLAFLPCEYALAGDYLDQGLALARELNDRTSMALALQVLGSVAREQGHYAQAVARHRESLALWRELDDKRGIARSLNYIGFAAWLHGDFAETTACCEVALGLLREQGDKEGVVWALLNLATVAQYTAAYERATTLGEESLALSRAIGYKEGIAWSLCLLGEVLFRSRSYAHAAAMLQEGLRLQYELGDRWRVASMLESLGGLADVTGQRRQAVWLFAAAEALRETVGTPLPPVEQPARDRHVTSLRAALSAAEFAAHWAEGRALPLDQVIACALELHAPDERQ